MKPDKITLIASATAFGTCGLAWLFLPSLQTSQRKVDVEASLHLERARRLLHLYNADLGYRAAVLDQLRDAEVDVDIADPQELAEDAGDEYQQLHTGLWTAFEPKDWQQDPPRSAKPTYGNLPSQIRDGIKGRASLVAENSKLLKEAFEEIEKAVSASSGDASGSSHFEANRLKGVIQYHRGLAERVAASIKRSEAERHRRRLVELANRGAEWATAQTLVADSGIDERIRQVAEAASSAERELEEDRKALAQLDATIDDLTKRLNAAQTRADQARAAMEKLERDGVDFSDPKGGETFARRLTEQDSAYREALREVQSLEAGRLPNADIDAGGDFLKGRYLENGSAANLTIEHGLSHYRNERIVLATSVDGQVARVADFRSDLARLEGIKTAGNAAQTGAGQRKTETAPLASETFDKLSRLESEAEKIEGDALKMLDQSASSSQAAAASVDEWIGNARERAQDLSPESKDLSPSNARMDDEWMAGHIAAQAADARLAKAWIHYDRFVAASQNAEVLATASQVFGLKEADADSQRTKAEEAHKAGIEEVTRAMEILEKAYRKTEKHWTLTAQAAGTTYLLALFGQKEYVAEAVEGYRNALKGRETEKYTEKLATRLKRLESR